jgi:ATP-dependent DNA helicase RecG
MGRSLLFVSSVQKEFAGERAAIRDFVRGDALLQRYFDVFLFEDLPASDRRADTVYLDEVDGCGVYVGLFGNEYSDEDEDGKSPTEREFERATEKGKTRLVFVKGQADKSKHPKMQKLIRRAGAQLIRRRFAETPDLIAALYISLVEYLERIGKLRTLPFDASSCPRAAMKDVLQKKVKWFLETAKRERNYALSAKTSRKKTLAHLNLLDDGQPTHAAILLFSENPQRVLPTSEVKCLHFHGTEVRKPIPSYQVYKGSVFELVDQAVDFVMSKLARSVGTREHSTQAPVEYELPRQAVTEAVVNAVAHRDYSNNASVQVMLFADRLEVWNPGELPSGLTPERLRAPHASIPRNPLIAEPLYLVHYIEKAGTGTLDMIALCREKGLPEPEFEQRAGQFVVTLWRDWLTDEILAGLDLNKRQVKAIQFLKSEESLSSADFQHLTGASRQTATRDLDDLVQKAVFVRQGKGRGTRYVICRKLPQR